MDDALGRLRSDENPVVADEDLAVADRNPVVADTDLRVADRNLAVADTDLAVADRDVVIPDGTAGSLGDILDRELEFGGDLPMMYDWLERRCRELGLLQGPRVMPVTILSVDMFERLMALAVEGTSVFWPLRQRRPHERFDIAFHRVSKGRVVRLPFMESEFTKLTDEAIASLFPTEATIYVSHRLALEPQRRRVAKRRRGTARHQRR